MNMAIETSMPAAPLNRELLPRYQRDLHLLDISFCLEADAPDSLQRLDALYAAPEFRGGAQEAAVRARFFGSAHGTRYVEVDGSTEVLRSSLPAGHDFEEWVFARLLDTSRRFLLVHAAAAACKGRGLMVVGPTFAGKTTLAVGLADSGLEYYSDELAPIERHGGVLYPFRRAAAVRSGAVGRVLRNLGSHSWSRERVPLPCRLGWVFVLGSGEPPAQAAGTLQWCLVVLEGAEGAAQALLRAGGVSIVSRSRWGGGIRLDLAGDAGSGLAETLRRLVDGWPDQILYLGPVPGPSEGAFSEEPVLSPLSREEATLEILRHTLNRRSKSELYVEYGQHPNLKAYAEIFSALESARCFRLRPGRPELTTRVLRALVDAVEPAIRASNSNHTPDASNASQPRMEMGI